MRCARSYREFEIAGAHSEIAIWALDTASEYLSMESDVLRDPKRPGSSGGDDVAEKGDVRRMGTSLAFWRPRT